HRRVLTRSQDPRMKISIFQFRKINLNAPFNQLFGNLFELLAVWLTQSHLTGLQVPDDSVPEMHWYSRIGKSGETDDCCRPFFFRLSNPLLNLKARGTRPITLGHQLAERVGVRLSRHRQI